MTDVNIAYQLQHNIMKLQTKLMYNIIPFCRSQEKFNKKFSIPRFSGGRTNEYLYIDGKSTDGMITRPPIDISDEHKTNH